MVDIAFQKPHLLYDCFVALSLGEHFFSFRHEVKAQLETQLEALKQQQTQKAEKANYQLSPVS